MLREEHDQDLKSIHFKGTVAVALYDHNQGSGYYEEFEIDRKFPFKRENLALSDSEKYSLEKCFGMCGDWLRGTDAPTLSFDAPKNNRKLKSSTAVQDRAREAELDRIFKAGGCTFGDMNYKRHRDVYYRNEIPCGSKCPHCDAWIDIEKSAKGWWDVISYTDSSLNTNRATFNEAREYAKRYL